MIAFYFVAFFPLLMGMGYTLAYRVVTAFEPQRAASIMARHGGAFYLLFLMIPLSVIALQAIPAGLLDDIGLRLPSAPAVDFSVALVVSLLGAALIGALLYYLELFLSVIIQQRALRKNNRQLSQSLEGESHSFSRQRHPFGPFMAMSVLISFAEEVVWRGFLIFYLTSQLQMPILAAIGIASAFFGMVHLHYGMRNVGLKTIDGFVWGLMMVITSSVIVSFISHVVFQFFVWRRLNRQYLKGTTA